MNHIFKNIETNNDLTLLLLHGTGGNEHDLLSLAHIIDPTASVLSVRGNVLENGMPRFFRRLAEGVFDEEDLVLRTKELNDFITNAAKKYGFNRERVVALGYSNGANIAASLLYHYEDALDGAILHHPMVPIRGLELPNLTGTKVFISAGKMDPICPPQESEELNSTLAQAGADVELFWTNGGHQLTHDELNRAKEWYEENFNN